MKPVLYRPSKDQEDFFNTTLVSKTAFIRQAVNDKIASWKNDMKKFF